MAEPPAPLLLALFEPDIAQNAGAMMRTCACLGVDAAIIEPAGFRINDSRFRRAGIIPIRARLRSLNVGIAATIAMTEALRQLGRLPSVTERRG
jgi:tRNA(Leu) C34 or U34 (ribose-2'-O)-methylase TrmL